ncbi:helix-turn-helix domain-containing protein [Sulfitobacter sp.]|uniref:helix-turn-helix domain-containing protein n=1 Tax=Sulfitobacter sp. TaxID=1903071 RepID=UPI0030014AE9
MYDPKGNGKDKAVQSVQFTESLPPKHLRGLVHHYIELRTEAPLAQDYRFHALPDACAYVVFDQRDPRITGVSKLRATAQEFNLGRQFHFVNIRFLPGVWQTARMPLTEGIIDQPYSGALPLHTINQDLAGESFAAQKGVLTTLVEQLARDGIIAPNPVTDRIFQNLEDITSVADMAVACDLSARQLQRVLKATTGFAPHDFLKILRLQQSLTGNDTWDYADQSHFIHSFRRATGYTPGKYARKFDV